MFIDLKLSDALGFVTSAASAYAAYQLYKLEQNRESQNTHKLIFWISKVRNLIFVRLANEGQGAASIQKIEFIDAKGRNCVCKEAENDDDCAKPGAPDNQVSIRPLVIAPKSIQSWVIHHALNNNEVDQFKVRFTYFSGKIEEIECRSGTLGPYVVSGP